MKSAVSQAILDKDESKIEVNLEEKTYSMRELLEMNPRNLEKMTFEVKNSMGVAKNAVPYVKVTVKKYENN